MMNNKKWSGSMSQKKKKAPSAARRQAAEQDRISLKIRREVAGVLLIALGVILGIFIYFSYQAPFAGLVKVAFFGLFGVCGYAVPLVAAGMGVFLIIRADGSRNLKNRLLVTAEILLLLSFVEVCFSKSEGASGYFSYLGKCFENGKLFSGGGLLGGLLAYPLRALFGKVGAIVLFSALLISGAMLITHFSIKEAARRIGQALKENRENRAEISVIPPEEESREPEPFLKESARTLKKAYDKSFDYERQPPSEEEKELFVQTVEEEKRGKKDVSFLQDEYDRFPTSGINIEDKNLKVFPDPGSDIERGRKEETRPERESRPGTGQTPSFSMRQSRPAQDGNEEEPGEYTLPYHLEFLNAPKAAMSTRGEAEQRRNMASTLEATLQSFNIDAEVVNIVTGPTVTRYEVQPAPGVKVSRIAALSNDIALSLAATSIRIEAPIPGKAAVGIEVPNPEVATVVIRELLESSEFKAPENKLIFALGKDITGKNIYGDLAAMPHLLIAGTTGAGKSICVNSIIMSLLYRFSPEQLQLLMVDPKVVEMQKFNGIPHMKTAVVTDPKKAPGMLNWVVNEMLIRYKSFADAGVREVDSYNEFRKARGEKVMPKLVIIIDELADLMMASAHEVEDAICRIAQLGRASGIHMVIATQTPRSDVITGMIKANIPSKIALTVSTALDSRIILDMGGAEKLLGRGDMLYLPVGRNKPVRLQGCYISDEENERVIGYLKGNVETTNFDEELTMKIENGVNPSENGEDESGLEDELSQRALEYALEFEQISTSLLQRKMKIGYNRAARIVDELEEKGFISPADGNKPRQVLITWQEYREMFGGEDVTDDWR